MNPPIAPKPPEVVGSGSSDSTKGYPLGKTLDSVVGNTVWAVPLLGVMVGVPAWVLYQLFKSKKKPKGANWPLLISIGLPAGYLFGSAYLRRKADQAREDEYKRKREEAAQAP